MEHLPVIKAAPLFQNIEEAELFGLLGCLRAKPRSADAGFSQVDIGMNGDLPARIELLDAFGQTTRVELSNIQANPSLPASEFQLT